MNSPRTLKSVALGLYFLLITALVYGTVDRRVQTDDNLAAAIKPTGSPLDPAQAPPPASPASLRWPPPELADPIVIRVIPGPSGSSIRLARDQDYVIQMPDVPLRRSLAIVGGRNIVLIGGEIAIPYQGENPSIAARTGLKIKDATGTVHIEGLLMYGEDISEGIQLDVPRATVQLQNIGIFNIHARDQVNFTDNHPDLIQTYGNVQELRIDRMTGSTDYQGLFFKADFNGPHGPIHIARTNIIGQPTARQLIWFEPAAQAGPVVLEDVWIDVPAEKQLADAIWPAPDGVFPAQAQITVSADNIEADNIESVSWPAAMSPPVTGRVFQGVPPGGNFVTPADAGIGYRSPGYRD